MRTQILSRLSRLTPATSGLESVSPCGPLGDLSGNLSSQVREEGHLDTGAGINGAPPVLPEGKTKAWWKHLRKTLPAPDFSHQSFNPLTQHCFEDRPMVLQIIIISNNGGVEGRRRGFAGLKQTRSHLPRYPIQNICLTQISRKLYSLETKV